MQRVQTILSQGVDGIVKTIYSSSNRLIGLHIFSGSVIVKSRHVIRTHRPIQGLVAFVPSLITTAAMGSLGKCRAALLQLHAMACRFAPTFGGWQLDRNEQQKHPGERSVET
jgi:hypothetical protein